MLSALFKKVSAPKSSRGRKVSVWVQANQAMELKETDLFSHFQSLAPSLSDVNQRQRYLAYLSQHPPSINNLENWIKDLRTATEREPITTRVVAKTPVKAKRTRSKTPVRRSRSTSRPKNGEPVGSTGLAIVSGGSCACGRR